jgi:DNA mismatch repair protein MutL
VVSSRPEARTTPGTAPGTWRGRAPDPDAEIRYLGQAFNLFLVAEVDDRIYFVDQHAAHERVLYEQLRGGLIERQKLLAGPSVELSPEEDAELRGFLDDLERCGFRLQARGGGRYTIMEIPAAAARLPAEHLCRFVRLCAGTSEDWERDVYSGLACRLAVKDGEVIDDRAGRELLERSFRIDPQRCPHGRPLWFEISRQALAGSVGRPSR